MTLELAHVVSEDTRSNQGGLIRCQIRGEHAMLPVYPGGHAANPSPNAPHPRGYREGTGRTKAAGSTGVRRSQPGNGVWGC